MAPKQAVDVLCNEGPIDISEAVSGALQEGPEGLTAQITEIKASPTATPKRQRF